MISILSDILYVDHSNAAQYYRIKKKEPVVIKPLARFFFRIVKLKKDKGINVWIEPTGMTRNSRDSIPIIDHHSIFSQNMIKSLTSECPSIGRRRRVRHCEEIDHVATHVIVGPLRPDHDMLPTSGKQRNSRQSAEDTGYGLRNLETKVQKLTFNCFLIAFALHHSRPFSAK